MKKSNESQFNLNNCPELINNTKYINTVSITNYYSNTYYQDKEIEIIYNNCLFCKGLSLNYNHNHYRYKKVKLTFDNCIIYQFRNSSKIEVTSDSDKNNFSIYFNHCILESIDVVNSQLDHLFIQNSIVHQKNSIVHQNYFTVENCEINNFHFGNCLGLITINNCHKSALSIKYFDNGIKIKKNYLKPHLNLPIENNNFIKSLIGFHTMYSINGIKSIYVDFQKNKLNDIVEYKTKLPSGGDKKNPIFYLNDNNKYLLNINIFLHFDQLFSLKVTIKDALLKSLSFNGKSDSIINIENCCIDQIFISNFKSKEIKFLKLRSKNDKSLFEITNSDLSTFMFNNSKLDTYKRFSIYKSEIEDIKFNATELPNEIESLENIHYPERQDSNYFELQYENYRQLKNALSKQGNQIKALKMHSKMYDAIEKSPSLSSQDKFILFLNRISNSHGASISRPFWLALGIMVSIFIIYCLGLPDAPYEFGFNGFKDFEKAFNNTVYFIISKKNLFFVLSDPTHRLSSLLTLNSEKPISFMNYFISFLSRILLAWAFYQFISAFRKLGHKSS